MMDNATFQLIIERLNKLSACQEENKSTACAGQEKIHKMDKHVSDGHEELKNDSAVKNDIEVKYRTASVQ
jgi:hypothetical protein